MSRQRATAFAPGHVTAFFSAHPNERPAAAGSRGAGLTLSDGVTVRVSAPGERAASDLTAGLSGAVTTIDGEPGTIGAVDEVLAVLGVAAADGSPPNAGAASRPTVTVDVETDIPIGAGFGVSGAAALGTALAANEAFDRGRSENELIRIAHEAEVSRGTGLGDVVAQARGGIPIRVEPGAPGFGALDGVPSQARVEYVTFGELSTEAVLSGDTTALSAAGERALDRLREDPRLPTLMTAAREFAADADLLVPEVAEAIDAVADATGEAAMAMLGRTVFALGTGLSDAGYDPAVCQTHPSGARLVDGEREP
ncbi:GHMP kinase [Halorubrum aidingense JCM 13560]|uniref:Pantoate kinase n=1 Tax=Halorubrum aidingense JCM 13560 TaxID=1230454 RepID=M0PM32_9EURY|nr:pantoate kinase [Halorubrum aidingense]EMA69820.1 GHMP kinase [Halorubrum aidingense JCM 13560]